VSHAKFITKMHEVHFFQRAMNPMHSNLRRLDLNLLLVLDALLRLRSVTAAANELAISASACSHALSRLRQTLGDELFVRQGNRMQPTQRAEQIAESLQAALQMLTDSISQGQRFDPSSSERIFTLAATDYTAFAILPSVMARLQFSAPKLQIQVLYSSQPMALLELAAGRIDFVLGFADANEVLPEGVQAFDWFSDDYVVIARQQHQQLQGELSFASYLAARHVVVTPWPQTRAVIDQVLDALAVQRHVAVQLPSVLAAAFIVAQSELLMTIPRRAAQTLSQAAGLCVYPAPFAIPAYTLKVYGLSKYASTDAHLWLRQELQSIQAEALPPAT
jgi:DNA-binding transcriptional LysR family regulator